MLRRLHPVASVAVVCYYAGSAMNVQELIRGLRRPDGSGEVGAYTNHAYIGNEADYVVLLTTRNGSTEMKHADFVHDPNITTVALTRAREALWIVGDMDYLAQVGLSRDLPNLKEESWRKLSTFIRLVANESPAMDEFYLRVLDKLEAMEVEPHNLYYENGILGTQDHETEDVYMSCIADCRINEQCGWTPTHFERR